MGFHTFTLLGATPKSYRALPHSTSKDIRLKIKGVKIFEFKIDD